MDCEARRQQYNYRSTAISVVKLVTEICIILHITTYILYVDPGYLNKVSHKNTNSVTERSAFSLIKYA